MTITAFSFSTMGVDNITPLHPRRLEGFLNADLPVWRTVYLCSSILELLNSLFIYIIDLTVDRREVIEIIKVELGLDETTIRQMGIHPCLNQILFQ